MVANWVEHAGSSSGRVSFYVFSRHVSREEEEARERREMGCRPAKQETSRNGYDLDLIRFIESHCSMKSFSVWDTKYVEQTWVLFCTERRVVCLLVSFTFRFAMLTDFRLVHYLSYVTFCFKLDEYLMSCVYLMNLRIKSYIQIIKSSNKWKFLF